MSVRPSESVPVRSPVRETRSLAVALGVSVSGWIHVHSEAG